MTETIRTGALRRVGGPAAVGLLLVLVGVAVFSFILVDRQGDHIAVIISADSSSIAGGTIRVAGEDQPPGDVRYVCDPTVSHLVVYEEGETMEEPWEAVVSRLFDGAKLHFLERATLTKQTRSVGGKVTRQVLGRRAILRIEFADGHLEHALGIGSGIDPGGANVGSSYLTIVQLFGPDGESLRIDADPLFNDRRVPWFDRLRGSPAHVVLFQLVPAEEEESATDKPGITSEDDEATKQVIENLRKTRPERGVIPAPGGG